MTATTISDTERREVARRLREDAKRYLLEGRFCSNEMPHRLAKAIECRYMGAGPQISELFPRLADLIDPDATSEQTNHDESSLSASPIDRDALLALADEIKSDTSRVDELQLGIYGSCYLSGISRRIREALGVSDG